MGFRVGPGLLRLIFAAMVVFSHLTHFETGRVAVMGFFVLSGYWVTATYCRNYEGSIRGVLVFYGARFFRIYPFYLVMLLLTLLLYRLTGDIRVLHTTDVTLFGLARVPAMMPILRPAWSLDVELQFYLLLPLLVAVAGHRRSIRLEFLIVASLAVTIGWWLWGVPRFGLNVLAYAAAFAIGMRAALNPIEVSERTALFSAGLFILAGLILAAIPSFQPLLRKDMPDVIDRDIVAMIWTVLLLPFMLWNVRVKSIGRDRIYGELAFAVYLTHWMFAKTRITMFGGLPYHLDYLATIAAMAIASYLTYNFIDRPIERVRRRWFAPTKQFSKREAEDLTVP